MLWKETKRWAKNHGYESSKEENSYSWFDSSNPLICGECASVSKLAKCIFNLITDNKWIEHQNNYETNK